jgi:hypothetical protein
MRQFALIPFSCLFLGIVFLGSSCSREGADNSTASGQAAQGASADSGGGTTSGATAVMPPGPPMKFEQPPVTNLSQIYSSTNPESFWTRSADFADVTVQEILPGRQFILVGTDKDHTLVVQLNQTHPELKPGQKVEVMGIIDPLGKDKSQWNVSAVELQVLERHSIFVREVSIRPAPDNR